MNAASRTANPFELLELPDGRCYVARIAATIGDALIAGSFARPPAPVEPRNVTANPVGLYATRDEAELAIQRAEPKRDPLAPFSSWFHRG